MKETIIVTLLKTTHLHSDRDKSILVSKSSTHTVTDIKLCPKGKMLVLPTSNRGSNFHDGKL
jgi:hypothetical protein